MKALSSEGHQFEIFIFLRISIFLSVEKRRDFCLSWRLFSSQTFAKFVSHEDHFSHFYFRFLIIVLKFPLPSKGKFLWFLILQFNFATKYVWDLHPWLKKIKEEIIRERERDKEKKGTKNKKREERYKFLRTMEEISLVIRPKCCDIL